MIMICCLPPPGNGKLGDAQAGTSIGNQHDGFLFFSYQAIGHAIRQGAGHFIIKLPGRNPAACCLNLNGGMLRVPGIAAPCMLFYHFKSFGQPILPYAYQA